MEKHNPIFSLKNFRSFGEEGADFELAPITVLTGCNSAGKSSLVKALFLMSMQGNKPGVLPISNLQISSKELNLGRFDKVIHKNVDGKMINLSYKMWSNYLQETVTVSRFFAENKNDLLNNGDLKMYTIEKEDGTLIYQYCPKAINYSDPYIEEKYEAIQSNFTRFSKSCRYVELKQKQAILSHKDSLNNEMKATKERMEKELLDFSSEIDIIRVDEYPVELLKKFVNRHNEDAIVDLYKDLSKEEKEKLDFQEYFQHVCNEVIAPWFINDIVYVNSSSAQIGRVYDISDSNKFCKALHSLNNKTVTFKDSLPVESYSTTHTPLSFVNKWIKAFGIGDRIEVEGTIEGLGVLIYLIRGKERTLLADEGYGITQLISLLMQIDNSIPLYLEGNPTFNLEKFEYDYSNLDMTYPHYVICVEEPEIHLHPKYQSLLADMFLEAYQKYNIHFIIETHSEYLIRKLQVMVADKDNTITSNEVSLNYVEKDGNGVSTNRKIEILEDGRLSEPFGPGFFDESKSLVMQMLKF
ncbi:MAG: DUF3696 domain-containing protein [Bacteroidales bacterium]|nr:DUF3696 domain-containing protein [Bacteroidales bacterium]